MPDSSGEMRLAAKAERRAEVKHYDVFCNLSSDGDNWPKQKKKEKKQSWNKYQKGETNNIVYSIINQGGYDFSISVMCLPIMKYKYSCKLTDVKQKFVHHFCSLGCSV